MQGTAADIIKRAMIAADQWITNNPNGTRMIMQVHDELVFEAPASQAEDLGREVSRLMEQAMELKVPIKVDFGIGPNWLECK